MNERIQELSNKCGLAWTLKTEYDVKNLTEFAELLVKECIEIVQPEPYDGDAMTASLNAKVKQIKQRFGVDIE